MSTVNPETSAVTASVALRNTPGVFYGYNVTTVTATGAINFYDAASATGKVLASIPASTAVGTAFFPPHGIRFNTGLYVEFAGGATGTVLVHHK